MTTTRDDVTSAIDAVWPDGDMKNALRTMAARIETVRDSRAELIQRYANAAPTAPDVALLPCPFCACETIATARDEDGSMFEHCCRCGARGPIRGSGYVERAWTDRTSSPIDADALAEAIFREPHTGGLAELRAAVARALASLQGGKR